jgi:hypothetical protein
MPRTTVGGGPSNGLPQPKPQPVVVESGETPADPPADDKPARTYRVRRKTESAGE